MSQQPTENVGVVDAYLRIFGGLTLLALGAGRKLGRTSSILAVVLGASKVAEGMTRYCPLYDLLDLSSAEGAVRKIQRTQVSPRGEERQVGDRPDGEIVERTFPWDEGSVEEGEPSASRRPLRRVTGRVWRPRSGVARSSIEGEQEE